MMKRKLGVTPPPLPSALCGVGLVSVNIADNNKPPSPHEGTGVDFQGSATGLGQHRAHVDSTLDRME